MNTAYRAGATHRTTNGASDPMPLATTGKIDNMRLRAEHG
jgi:hypothetical protein